MEIKAKIAADSKNEYGNRITTFVLTYPRIIHAEFMTHRMFSRNAASSRAVPFEKLVKSVEETPFIPLAFQRTHKGMQGSEYFTDPDINTIRQEWLYAKDEAVKSAKILNEVGVTKQLVNRLLEPFQWYTCIVTATEWENFFALRCPQYEFTNAYTTKIHRSRKDWIKEASIGAEENYWHNFSEVDWLKKNKGQAEIHMMALAEAMWDTYNESTPKELEAGEWHIPFGDKIDPIGIDATQEEWDKYAVKIATARCARVSYTVVGEEDKPINYDSDIKLHDKLLASGHMSPFEHCAQVTTYSQYSDGFHESGNFKGGWVQYRKTIVGENKTL